MNTNPLPRRARVLLPLALLLCVLFAWPSHADTPMALGVVTGGRLHLREQPSSDAGIIATYASGTQVLVESEQNGWLAVEVTDGRKGYMDARYVYMSTLGIVENGGSYVNLRSGPTRDAKVIGQYATGTALTILSEASAGWYYVDISGVQGYMAASFIQPAPAGTAPLPVATPNTGTDTNPYELRMEGASDVVHQVGHSEAAMANEPGLVYTLYYPVLGQNRADEAIAQWISDLIDDARVELADVGDEALIEMTTQYDSFYVAGRYIGVLETGFFGGTHLAHPGDLIFTLNADAQTGALLSHKDIFGDGNAAGVLALLHDRLAALEGNPVEGLEMDESWLDYAVLTGEGVAIVLPKSMYLPSVWGTQSVLLPYATLRGAGLLALDIGEDAQAPAATPAPQAQQAPSGGRVIDPSKPMIALTFDDGPSDYTHKILDLLDQYGGVATFCMVGNRIANYQDVVARVARQGSEIATHTWSHKQLTTLSHDGIASQLKRSMDAITAVTGQPVTVMRPPYGSVDRAVRDVCRELGLVVATWSVDTEDWKTNNASATYNEIMRHAKNGSIVLCHDVKPSTSVAMERVIPELIQKGYQLVTVSELLSFAEGGAGAQTGVVYSHLDTSGLGK